MKTNRSTQHLQAAWQLSYVHIACSLHVLRCFIRQRAARLTYERANAGLEDTSNGFSAPLAVGGVTLQGERVPSERFPDVSRYICCLLIPRGWWDNKQQA